MRFVGRVVSVGVEAGIGLALLALLVGVAALVGIGLTVRIATAQSRRLLAHAPRWRRAMPAAAPVAPPAAWIESG